MIQKIEVNSCISSALSGNELEYLKPIGGLGLLTDLRKPGVMPRYHWHPHIEINILYNGWIECSFYDEIVRITAPQICIFWAQSPHKVTAISEDSFFGLLQIPMNLLLSCNIDQDIISRVLNDQVIIIDNDGFISKDELCRWQKYSKLGDPKVTQMVEDELQLMIRRLIFFGNYKLDTQTKPLLSQKHQRGISDNCKKNIQIMLEYIASNYLGDIDVSDVAMRAKLHPKYAMNLFKKTLHTSIKRYIVMVRLNHAKQLLHNTEIPIQEVALQSGFKHQSSFFAAFKYHIGGTPQSFRVLSQS